MIQLFAKCFQGKFKMFQPSLAEALKVAEEGGKAPQHLHTLCNVHQLHVGHGYQTLQQSPQFILEKNHCFQHNTLKQIYKC